MTRLKQTILVFTVALLMPLSALADSWSCRHDNDVREVHVTRSSDAPAPCKVVYKKLTEGFEDQVLWNAQNDGAYCDDKASAFVDKLEGWGWTCAETIMNESGS